MHRVSNKILRDQCQISNAMSAVKQQRKEWNEHVCRANNNSLIRTRIRDKFHIAENPNSPRIDEEKVGSPHQLNLQVV